MSTLDELRRAQAALDRAYDERDRLIIKASQQAHSLDAIKKATGLSYTGISIILSDHPSRVEIQPAANQALKVVKPPAQREVTPLFKKPPKEKAKGRGLR